MVRPPPPPRGTTKSPSLLPRQNRLASSLRNGGVRFPSIGRTPSSRDDDERLQSPSHRLFALMEDEEEDDLEEEKKAASSRRRAKAILVVVLALRPPLDALAPKKRFAIDDKVGNILLYRCVVQKV